MKKLAPGAALALALLGAAEAHADEDLSAQIEAANKAIRSLEGRIQTLEAEKAKAAAPAAPPPPAAGTAPAELGAVVVAPKALPQAGAPDAGKARLEIYGFAQLDIIQDVKGVDPDWTGTLRSSKIPVACPADPGCGKIGETTFSIRGSRLGVKGFIPTAVGELKTQFEFDLFGLGRDAGKTTFHLAKAWAELGPVLVGQIYTLFMDVDVFPNTFNYWGPIGMTYLGNPQLRVTPFNRGGIKLAVALEEPATRVDSSSKGFAGVSEMNRFPDLTVQFRLERDWGHLQAAGMLRLLGYHAPGVATGSPSGTLPGSGASVGAGIKTVGKDQILVQLNGGVGISNYINDFDCCSDVATDAAGRARAVPLVGWMLYYDHAWSDRWGSAVGWSGIYQSSTSGQGPSTFKLGQYASANLLFYPAKNVKTGFEVIYASRENQSHAYADDTRFQLSAKCGF